MMVFRGQNGARAFGVAKGWRRADFKKLRIAAEAPLTLIQGTLVDQHKRM